VFGRVNHHTASRYLTRVSHPRHYSPSPKTSFIYTSLRSIDRRHLATPRKMSTPDDPTDDGLTIFFSCVSVFLGINAVVAVRSFLKSRNVDFQGTQPVPEPPTPSLTFIVCLIAPRFARANKAPARMRMALMMNLRITFRARAGSAYLSFSSISSQHFSPDILSVNSCLFYFASLNIC
jgi:hypothetical protein